MRLHRLRFANEPSPGAAEICDDNTNSECRNAPACKVAVQPRSVTMASTTTVITRSTAPRRRIAARMQPAPPVAVTPAAEAIPRSAMTGSTMTVTARPTARTRKTAAQTLPARTQHRKFYEHLARSLIGLFFAGPRIPGAISGDNPACFLSTA